jgi:aldehyde:ferredoxin oxidoreductase
MLDEYYGERCWDLSTGVPTRDTLIRLGLRKAADDMSKIKP